MGIATREGGSSRLYWLWSIPPVAVLAPMAGWLLAHPAPLLALGWIPLAAWLALAGRSPATPPATRTTATGNTTTPAPGDDARLRKEYWDRRLQAARQRRQDRHPTPVSAAGATPAPQPPRPAPAPPAKSPEPATPDPTQRQALARKLAPQVYQRIRKQAPDLPPEQVKKLVLREVQRLIDRKRQTPSPPPTSPAGGKAPDAPIPAQPAVPGTATPPPPLRVSPPTAPHVAEPVLLDPVREQARQRAVAEILELARKSSRRNRLRRQTQPFEDDDRQDRPFTLPRDPMSHRTITACMSRCNSSVERELLQALIEEASLKPQKTELKGVIGLQIQVKMFKYNVDFLVDNRLAVEVVEFAYNNNKMTQIRDRVRGQTLSQTGYLSMQVTAEEISADPRATARRIIDTARKFATPLEDKPPEPRSRPLAPPGRR